MLNVFISNKKPSRSSRGFEKVMLKKLHTDIFAHKNAVNAYIIPSQPLWTAIKGEQYSE